MIDDQSEIDYDDMVSNSLVQFEYDIFTQIKQQLHKRTNALFQICKVLAKAFVQYYSQYTKLRQSNISDKQLQR